MTSDKSNILYDTSSIYFLDDGKINELKDIALKHPLKRSRVCLHKSEQSLVHEMVIVAHSSSYLEPHRHPKNKPESYHVLEGELKVNIFDDDGDLIKEEKLFANKHPRMYRIHGQVWHQPVPQSEWVVYHEVATGPFVKDEDVIYMK